MYVLSSVSFGLRPYALMKLSMYLHLSHGPRQLLSTGQTYHRLLPVHTHSPQRMQPPKGFENSKRNSSSVACLKLFT
jgi:hypothetical protein